VIITVTPTGRLTPADLAARGVGTPGRGPFNGESVIVPVQDLELPLVALVVGSDGAMPPAPSSDMAAWYDFSAWPGLGGLPGAGGNVVLAVRNGRIRVGAGDYLNVQLKNGSTVCYRVEWTKIDEGFAGDYEALVTATAGEFVTLIGAGPTQDERMITSARRAECAAQPAATPTPTPRAGHQELHIVARGSQFTLIEGNTIPVPIHTIDLLFDNLDQGVTHHIVFYDPQRDVYFDAGEVQGRTAGWRAQIPAGPRTGSTQHYTFRCIIHPSMTGDLFVE
jgi:hypothetical protein